MEEHIATILLIDDEPGMLMGLKLAMKRAGYNVITATNGADGEKMAKENLPDVIISDMMMPPPDGLELRQLLSQDPTTEGIPFIFLTARADQTLKQIGLESGADDYITKPFDRTELLARVKAVLRRQEKGRQRGRQEAEGELNNLRQVISNNLTHELRTPLASVLSTLDLALKDRFAESPEQQAQFINVALRNAEHLQRLVEDLIAVSELDMNNPAAFRQKLNLEFDFHIPIKKCQNLWQEKNLQYEIRLPEDISIHAPRLGFKQAVFHLLDNACKFSMPGGKICIDLAPLGNGGCTLTITDEGPGIPEELHEKVFERYFQAEQGDVRTYGGLGVGLTIVRAYSRSVGGDTILLPVQKGTSVQMTIPPAESDWKQ